jgi:hypothetical protein
VLPWVAPAALVLTFVLSFFPWVGRFPGGHAALTQNAWQAAFNGWSEDRVYAKRVQADMTVPDRGKVADMKLPMPDGPGVNLLLLFCILTFVPALVLALAVAALPHVQYKLPPAVERLRPWRWALVGALTTLAVLFLLLQALTGFTLESQTRDLAAKALEAERKRADTDEGEKRIDMLQGALVGAQGLERTAYLRLAFCLMLLAALGAWATHWLELRGPGRPRPRVEWMW